MLAIEGPPNYDTARQSGAGGAARRGLGDRSTIPIRSPVNRACTRRAPRWAAPCSSSSKARGGATARPISCRASGGNAGQGQIWEYEPCSETLTLIFESPAAEVLNAPDNICASPRGGFILCEDGSGTEFLHGLTVDGNIFRFAQNNVVLRAPDSSHGFTGDFRGSEFAGATYSPDGRWLFVNIQSPGITFAITGPWRNGAL